MYANWERANGIIHVPNHAATRQLKARALEPENCNDLIIIKIYLSIHKITYIYSIISELE